MKRFKRLGAVILGAATIAGTMTAYVPAVQAADQTGSITIDNAISGEDYKVYQILDLESFDAKKGTYSYKADSDWEAFLTSDEIKDQYISIEDGYVTWVEGADVAAFASLAMDYVTEKGLTADGKVTAAGTSASISSLDLGYYLLDSSIGTVCSLDTTNPDAKIKEKNSRPTIEKEVKEEHKDSWGDKSCASIGDTVNFRSKVHIGDGAVKYFVHDQMEAGLTFTPGSVKVLKDGNEIDSKYYEVKTDSTDGCTFEVEIKDDYLKKLTSSDTLVITYSAVLNKDAKVADEHNDNETWISYGDKQTVSEKDKTETYTYKFDLIKTDKDGKILTGAKFSLYDQKDGGIAMNLVKTADGKYRVAQDGETKDVTTTIDAGYPEIAGLGTGTYYLEETKAPEGYNKLTSRVEVKIDEANNLGTIGPDQLYQEGGVQIVNKSGLQLPSTGGMGTTAFYLSGVILIAGASLGMYKKKKDEMNEKAE